MNENLDLVNILKNCPKGTKLYLSVIDRDVTLLLVKESREYPICVIEERNKVEFDITRSGRLLKEFPNSEIVLFPSKNQRDWSKFKVPVKKFDYGSLKPFDKVLVRNSDSHSWRANFLSHIDCGVVYCVNMVWGQTIPYNDETKHLIGTDDMPDKKYIWWEG